MLQMTSDVIEMKGASFPLMKSQRPDDCDIQELYGTFVSLLHTYWQISHKTIPCYRKCLLWNGLGLLRIDQVVEWLLKQQITSPI